MAYAITVFLKLYTVTPKKQKETFKEGDLVYVVKRKSKHPFNKGDALWVINVAGDFMVSCYDYHKNTIGYLYTTEISKKRPWHRRIYTRSRG